MKRCSQCKKYLDASRFHKNRHAADGLQNQCIPCHQRARRASYVKHREARLTSTNAYRKSNLDVYRKASAKWDRENPEKRRAHRAVRTALAQGGVARPERCEGCGQAGPVEAHHEDYDKPLDVIWLCKPCHEEEHH